MGIVGCGRWAVCRAAFRALEGSRPDAADQFSALHREYPEDPCIAFHYQRLAAGEQGTLIVMTEK